MFKSFATTCLLFLGVFPSVFVLAAKLRVKPASDAPFGKCTGACKSNKDCKKHLICTRAKGKKVVGCNGIAKPGKGYCIPAAKGSVRAPNQIKHLGTTRAYVYGEDVYHAKIKLPAGTQYDDLLLLVLHRTDDYLPLVIGGGWTRACECFKNSNSKDCATYKDCKQCVTDLSGTRNVFCEKFKENGQLGTRTEGSGKDLAQAIFYKAAGKAELSWSRTIKINFSPRPERTHPGWMFLSTFRGADTKDPIRDWNGTGNDKSRASVFPSAYGRKGDYLLLSQSFDSGAPGVREGDFLPPKGFQNFASMFDCDNVDTESSPYPLGLCQGDCDKDKECKGELTCFERDDRQSVPGCYGSGIQDKDYCYDAKRKSRKKKLEFIASDKPKCDESGYLFGKVLSKTGYTGVSTTRGHGKNAYKSDALVSVTIIPKGGFKDEKGRGASEWLGTRGDKCPRKRNLLRYSA